MAKFLNLLLLRFYMKSIESSQLVIQTIIDALKLDISTFVQIVRIKSSKIKIRAFKNVNFTKNLNGRKFLIFPPPITTYFAILATNIRLLT